MGAQAGFANVILVSHGFQTNYERGFVNGLAANEIDATLISSDRTDYAALSPRTKTHNFRGSQEEGRPRLNKLGNLFQYHFAVWRHVLQHRDAIVHVIGLLHPPILCGIIEGLFFRTFARKYVLTVHDLLPHDRHTRLNRWIAWASFRLAHQLVAHTRKMRQQLVDDFGIAGDRIVVMEHGIEPLPAETRFSRHDPSTDPNRVPRLLFFGFVAPYKGLDILLKALDGIPDKVELHIMGRARSDKTRSRIRSLVEANRHFASIVWRDEFVPEEDVAGIFSESDVLVLPYRWIDQSGVLFQALRFGVPVIASRVGSFEDYVSPDIGMLFDAHNEDQLRDCLTRFIRDRRPYDRGQIRRHGRGFEWSRTVRALEPIYTDVKPLRVAPDADRRPMIPESDTPQDVRR